ncbi:PAS domain-containing sensor histidine kinase [Halorubrum sp. AD140]|uniref:PAS domain-containing sensor histidine kinase n=1 Tax=Halorubrum sp. AD140 TaxID=3050073 RepID=UPI002ACCFCBB|nr:PAS domain-containing sensor histidine kinase [Halorubrum sp. AD140]MDZ5812584.1 PAS domain-containing sensor histidine kinase [Halorubrum sp. AD140]
MTDTCAQTTEELSALVDHLDRTTIWTVSEPGTFDYISDGFEKLWGISADVLRDDPAQLLETIHPDDRDFVRSQMEQDPEELSEIEYEARIVRPDGEVRWMKTEQIPIWDTNGDLSHVIGLSTDITEQKHREEELAVLNQILRHDIKNDMAVILGWMEFLEDHVDQEGREYLQKTLSSGRNIVELINSTRDYVELIVEDDEMDLRSVPLKSILQTEIDIRREMYPNTTFVVDGEIPDVSLLANDLLSSVFRNVLNNAVQHNDTAEPQTTVSFADTGTAVVIQIADNGPGIPDDQKELLFDKQAKGAASSSTGMGLYLTATLVRNFGGEIWVEDTDSTGSVFKIKLPKAN